MRLILTGIEYAGKRTLAVEISRWWAGQTGGEFRGPPDLAFHDHFTVPHVVHAMGHEDHKELSEKQMLALNPGLMEQYQRYQIVNKLTPGYVRMPDLFLIDWFYSDAVYAPLYYGYGGPGQYADRTIMARRQEAEALALMPDFVLVLMEATPEEIRKRIGEAKSPFPRRHKDTLFQEKDTEAVLERFQRQYDVSLFSRKFTLETTDATVDETLGEFIEQVRAYITPEDRLRVISYGGSLGRP